MRGRSSERQASGPSGGDPPRQRIDLWLWHARLVKTRPLAAELAESGHVRINGSRVRAAGKFLRPGDVLTVALERDTRVLRVAALGVRRGPFVEARQLYDDLAGEPPMAD